MKYDSVQLGEISEAIRGVTFSGDETSRVAFDNSLACLTTSGVQDVVNWDSRRFIPRNRLANSKQLLHEGDILISTANSKELVGKSCIVDRLPYEATFGAFVTVIRPNKKVTPEYLAFWMRTKEFLDKCYLMSSNTTNISNLRTSELLEYEIPLPPLTEQKRIASLLARADRLRQLRRTAHDLGDALLQSVFLEMFGHVRVNDKKWELARFEDVCETRLGKMLDDKKQTGKNKRPYLRNFNVRWHSLDLSDIAEMDFDEKDRKEFRLQYGDVLICEGGEVGRAAIWRNEMEECYFQKALHRARPNSKLANPEYIVHLLWWMAQSGGLVDSTSQVTFAHLTGEKLKELVIPVPPLSLQEEFAGVVARVESLRGRMGESTRQVEGLFESLLAEAFS
ncbi:MAG: restriction endonuclease subunit S [Chloroflexi bacterium]|nr:restriction endonuclease subunit S [Chloroflexota bacterium]